MKHPSRWPYILRMPICMAITCLVWWGPAALGFLALKRWGMPPEFSETERFVIPALLFVGWSILIMRTLVFRVIEPFFNAQSLQNPFGHLFRPEPVHFRSFREWFDWMFRSVEGEPSAQDSPQRDRKRKAS
jgi:hypothetical protein